MRQHLLTLVRGLLARGVTVEVAGPASEPLLLELSALSCPIWDIPLSAALRPGEDLAAGLRLIRLLRSRAFDLVHVHGFKASLPGRVAAALTGTPVIYTVHNFVCESGGGLRRRVYLWLERLLSPATHRYVAVSAALRQNLVAAAGLPAERVTVVYSGVPAHPRTPEATKDALRRELRLAGEERLLLCVARLVPEKGVDVLLQAAALLGSTADLPAWRLVVAGDGPEEAALVALRTQLKLDDRVVLLGHRTDVAALLDLAAVVAVPSRAEGLSLFLLETLAAGRPVVASAAGGMTELVRDGENGLLVPPGEPEALAAALRRLLTDADLAARLSAGARARSAGFTVEEMLDQTLALYGECARRSGRRRGVAR
ncbi:MAG: glycosyltransferase [Chitinophagales bacterium]